MSSPVDVVIAVVVVAAAVVCLIIPSVCVLARARAFSRHHFVRTCRRLMAYGSQNALRFGRNKSAQSIQIQPDYTDEYRLFFELNFGHKWSRSLRACIWCVSLALALRLKGKVCRSRFNRRRLAFLWLRAARFDTFRRGHLDCSRI